MKQIRAGRHQIQWGHRTLIMGILNVTPDSFSDGGSFLSLEQALAQARLLISEGADLLDIGGESTRPGSTPVSAEDEAARILPVIEQIGREFPDTPISVDTWKSTVAHAALAAGASLVNDITGLLADPLMAGVCKKWNAGLILMHNAVSYRFDHPAAAAFRYAFRLDPDRARSLASLPLRQAMLRQLEMSIAIAGKSQISPDNLIVDPGIGFGLTTEESLSLIRHLSDLKPLDLPVLLAPSRKRFIGEVLNVPADQRQAGTAAAVTAGIAAGASIVRVHDVAFVKPFVLMSDAIWQDEPVDNRCRSSKMADQDRLCIEKVIGQSALKRDTIALSAEADAILMRGMVFRGYTGVMEEEKKLGQAFSVDLKLELYKSQAFQSDVLEDSVSYADVYAVIQEIIRKARFNLIERLAEVIAQSILDQFDRISAVEIIVGKPNAPIDGSFDAMAVQIRRSRPSHR